MPEETKQEDVKQEPASAETPEVSSAPAQQVESKETLTESAPSEKPKERYVPLTELQKERAKRRELETQLRSEIDGLKAVVQKSTRPEKVKEIMTDLGVDEDTATKMYEKYNFGKETAPVQNELEELQNNFMKKATDVSQDHLDWDDYKPEMTSLLQSDYEKNPKAALSRDPEHYYLKAKLLRSEKEKDRGVQDVIDKSNSKNLASTESGKNGSTKPGNVIRKGSRAWLQSLTNDEFTKNYDYIKSVAERDGFKE